MMRRYAAYRDSGIEWIGEIPEGWNVSRVQNCFTEEKRTNEELDSFHALKFSNGSIIQKSESWDENEIADTYSAYKVVSSGAIVINNLNLNFDLKSLRVGMVEEEGIITSAYLTMNPSSDHQYPRYYDYLFKSYDYKKAFHNMGRGLRKTLNWQEFCKYSCIVPSPYEQNAIAGFLDTRTAEIDSLIAEQEKSIKLLQEYRKAVISEAVTKGLDPDVPMKDSGIEWIGEIPEGWSVVKQSMLGQSVLGKMLDEKTSKVGEMRPYLSNRDVQWLSINTTNLKKMGFPLGDNERYTLRNGDVLICEGGEIGRCAVWDKGDTNISFQKAVHRFRPNRNVLNSYYFGSRAKPWCQHPR